MRNLFFDKKFIWIGLLFLIGWVGFSACRSSKKKGKEEEQKEAYQASGNKRLQALTDSIGQSPDSAELYFERGNLWIETEDFTQAEQDLKKAIQLQPMASNYYTALGQLYLNETFIDSAETYFSLALKLDGKNKIARLQKAFTLWLKDQYQATLRQTDTLLKQDPNIPDALGLQSQVYSALGDSDRALQIMEKVLKIPPVSYDAFMRMGDLLLHRNPDSALEFYKKASTLDTTEAEPYYCIGLIYEKKRKLQKAVQSYQKAIVFDAHYLPTYMRLGRLFEQSKEWEKAQNVYTLATRMAPTNAEAYYRKARTEEKLGEKASAKSDYEQALIFDDKNEKARQALERMK